MDTLTTVRLGFLPLSDCAPLLVAERLGLGERHGIRVALQRLSSWASLRDQLLSGEVDAAHTLYGMVYGMQLGVAGPQAEMALLMTLNRNGQAITLSKHLVQQLRGGCDLRTVFAGMQRRPVLAHTFPTGTHAMWLCQWIENHGVDPLRDVDLLVIPPSQMPTALAAGDIDGFCAGEPWHAVATEQGGGETVACTSDVWRNHPEKALACRREWAALYPDLAVSLIRTVRDACEWLGERGNLTTAAQWLADDAVIGVPARLILPRMLGDYGSAPLSALPCPLTFADNRPLAEDGAWFLTRFRHWGLWRGGDDAAAIARRVTCTDIFDLADRSRIGQ
jgi:nitrate/nitrite transport system substrate-binding protein